MIQFRDLQTQYKVLKKQIDKAVSEVLDKGNFISGSQVKELESQLAAHVGVKHCITCANGTDALELALKAIGVGESDAVFVPDFTFFASGEAPAQCGAMPVFVDIEADTYNIDPEKLEIAIKTVIKDGRFVPKVIVTVDLFGLPANYNKIRAIAEKYSLKILEDGAQGFGGEYFGKKACGFGDISTTSFFPAKPLGCYGDGGAIFTDNDDYADLIRSLCVHGKGTDKYHNIRLGSNSRLDTIQAAILLEKLKAFREYELEAVNKAAKAYRERLENVVVLPSVPEKFYSSWAQYTIRVTDENERNNLQEYLKKQEIPTNVYYPVPMHEQKAFKNRNLSYGTEETKKACKQVLSLPIGPYITEEEIEFVCEKIKQFYNKGTGE